MEVSTLKPLAQNPQRTSEDAFSRLNIMECALLFDRDSILFKPCFPSSQPERWNREGDVQFAISIIHFGEGCALGAERRDGLRIVARSAGTSVGRAPSRA